MIRSPSMFVLIVSALHGCAHQPRPVQSSPEVKDLARRVDRALLRICPLDAASSQRCSPLKGLLKELAVPGVSVAVFDEQSIVARAAGVRASTGTQLVTPDTLFQTGSISKPVAALALMRLVEQGKLSLEADVNEQLKSWKLPRAADKSGVVNLRRLLSHTAGLTMWPVPEIPADLKLPSLAEVLDGKPMGIPRVYPPVRVFAKPGSRWHYSGGGYCLAQLLGTDATGKPFERYVQELVLEPLGMRRSTYRAFAPPDAPKNVAVGHDGKAIPYPSRWKRVPCPAAAGLWSTATELAKFLRAVQSSARAKAGSIVGTTTVKKMLLPQTPPPSFMQDWGVGFLLEEGEHPRFGHHGDNSGYQALMIGYKARQAGVVILTNSNNGYKLAERVLRALVRGLGWPGYRAWPAEVKSADVSKWLGAYQTSVGVPARLVMHDGAPHLELLRINEGLPKDDGKRVRLKLRAVSPGEMFFVTDGHPHRLILAQDAAGSPTLRWQLGARWVSATAVR